MIGKKQKYPTKTTLNLVIKDRPAHYYRNTLLIFVILAVFVGAFAKFAVIDVLSAANELQQNMTAERARYDQLAEDNAVYTQVRAEYEKYFANIGGDGTYADCIVALSIVESNLMTGAGVQSISFTGNTLNVILTGIDLEQATNIVGRLYANKAISAVSMSSADTTNEKVQSSFSLVITMAVEEEGKSQ